MEIAAPYQPGSTRRVTVTLESEAGRTAAEADITVAEPGWTMWMVSHFHYDPVWWNTQGQFTEARLSLPDEDGTLPDVRSAFELVGRTWTRPGRTPTTSSCWPRSTTSSRTSTPSRRTGRPAAADGRRPGGDRRRQLQRAEHQPDQRRSHHPQRRLRHRVPAGRVRRRPAQRVDAGRVRARSGLSGPDGGGRPDLLGVGARAVPPVGPVRGRGRRPADAVRHRVRVDLAGRPRAAHRLHGAPLRRRLAAAHPAGPGRPPNWRRTGSSGRWRRSRPRGTSCCRSARTTSSRPAG